MGSAIGLVGVRLVKGKEVIKGVTEHAGCPVGVGVCRCEPRVSQDEVIWAHVGDVEVEKMRDFSGDDFELGIVFQAPSCIRGAVGVLEFLRVFYKMYP